MSLLRDGAGTLLHQLVGHPDGGLWEASSFFKECFCYEDTELSCEVGVSGEQFTAPASVLFSCIGSMCMHTHLARVCFYISARGNQDR